MIRRRIKIRGVVQGVGFRPFIYKLAHIHGLSGFVRNGIQGVEIAFQGDRHVIEACIEEIFKQLPPLARIDDMIIEEMTVDHTSDTFEIIQSNEGHFQSKSALISPDITTCPECLKDMREVSRYKDYFAVNCTNCGPRYSIIKTVPYDRCNTSMAVFEMCSDCEKAYHDPLNRRYHAQPISCNRCGPVLSHSIEETARMIKEGKIVAIKGIGGFHIVCDATNDAVVQRLRKFKNRPDKPFALMCKDIAMVQSVAHTSDTEEKILTSKEAPIVLMYKKEDAPMPESIAPGIDRIGCMLAYTPLHHLLFNYLQVPIVATSANLGDEPIIIDEDILRRKLPFVEFVLDHNRPIVNAVDDSVVQVSGSKIQILRLARGYAPKVIKLPFKTDKHILAVGANQKNTIVLAMDDTLILSPHIGDLDSLEAFEYFKRTVETFKRFYDFEPEVIICDRHPEYMTAKWAKAQNVPVVTVQHHLAHIYACKAEHALRGDYIGFSFDGTGYGDEGMLWGGEVFVGDTRAYHFKPVRLLGGEKAIREPRRVALAMLFERYSLEEVKQMPYACVKSFSDTELELLHHSYTKAINAPLSSSVGRLFDGIASFGGLVQHQSYEGQAGLLCETRYDPANTESFAYRIENGQIDIHYDFDAQDIVTRFINTLVAVIADIAQKENKAVILTGGVFQNKTLMDLTCKRLDEAVIAHYTQEQTPINDGGIALGQLFWYLEQCELGLL